MTTPVMRRSRFLLVLCAVGIAAFVGHPRAQAPLVTTFHGIGDLVGGGVGSAVRDATRVGGTIYAVGASTTISTATLPNVPQLDTPARWTWAGSGSGAIEALPAGTGVATNGNAGASLSAYAITSSGTYLASQARSANSGTGTRWVRVDRSLLSAADPSIANLDISNVGGVPVAFAALAISDAGDVLYGQGTNADTTRTPRRYEAGVGINVVDIAATGKTWGVPIPRGTSDDGLVMVGAASDGAITVTTTGVAPNQVFTTNARAFRYEHTANTLTGTTSLIPLLTGGTWNMPVAISGDETVLDQTVVVGNSTAFPNGEVYLTDSANAITARLGSPNTGLMPRALGGMTADGSVVAVTFSVGFGVGQIGGLQIPQANAAAYIHTAMAGSSSPACWQPRAWTSRRWGGIHTTRQRLPVSARWRAWTWCLGRAGGASTARP